MLITKTRHYQPYTPEEIEYVKQNAFKLSDEIIGLAIGRSQFAIYMVRHKLRLVKGHAERKLAAYIIRQANIERRQMIEMHKKVVKMRELIALAEKEENNFKKDKIKQQLKKLSGL